MKIRLIALTILFAAAAPLFAQQGGCTGLAFSSDQKGKGKFDTTFSATEVMDVDFSVLFPPGQANKLAGDHKVEIRIFTPRGHLYQSVTVAFSADSSRKGKHVTVAGYPDGLDTQVLEPVTTNNGNQLRVFARLPVAGTYIVSSSLYGTWTAQAFVDDEAMSCSKAASFVITQ